MSEQGSIHNVINEALQKEAQAQQKKVRKPSPTGGYSPERVFQVSEDYDDDYYMEGYPDHDMEYFISHTRYSTKDRQVALLLCIFLGYLGIHRFYTGKVRSGFLYMFTLGIFGLGWIRDILLLISMSFKDGDGLDLK